MNNTHSSTTTTKLPAFPKLLLLLGISLEDDAYLLRTSPATRWPEIPGFVFESRNREPSVGFGRWAGNLSEGETSAGIGLVSSHLPPNFSQVPASWSYCRCVMKREIPVWNKSDLHSPGVMICVDWPHSPACKKIRFSRASKQEDSQGFGLSDPHLLGPQVDGAPVSWNPLWTRNQFFVVSFLTLSGMHARTRWCQLLPPTGRALPPRGKLVQDLQPAFGKLIIAATGEDQEENEISSAFTCADGFRGCFDPWPSLSNKYHRSRGNTIIRSRQGRPFVGGVRSRWLSVPNHGVVLNTRHNHVISAASSPLVSLFHRFLSTSLLPPSFHSHNATSTPETRAQCSWRLSPVLL